MSRSACGVSPSAATARPMRCRASPLKGSRASTARHRDTASARRPWLWSVRACASVAALLIMASRIARVGYADTRSWRSRHGRLLRVALDQVAERRRQRRKPRLIVTPLIDTVTVDRSADLLRADRLHDARIFVELQALWLERQPAVVEELAQLTFRIVDDSLVVHAVQPSGCRRASMIAARGNIRWMRPMWLKLPSILSTKRGLSKGRYTWVRNR